MSTESERRKFPRFERRLMLKYRCIKTSSIPDSMDYVAAIEDISKGGLELKTKKVYAPESILRLYFPESAMGPARTLHAKVVRTKPTHDREGFLLGLQFVKFEEQAGPMSEEQKNRTTRRYESSDLGDGAERHTKRLTQKPSATGSGADRRKHPRWEQRILVKYRCVTKGVMYDVDDRVGMLLDFSRGGLVIAALREYTKEMVLQVKLPDSPVGPAQTVFARVLWSTPHEKPGQFKIGGQFVKAVANA